MPEIRKPFAVQPMVRRRPEDVPEFMVVMLYQGEKTMTLEEVRKDSEGRPSVAYQLLMDRGLICRFEEADAQKLADALNAAFADHFDN